MQRTNATQSRSFCRIPEGSFWRCKVSSSGFGDQSKAVMNNKEAFSEQLRQAAGDQWERIVQHRFTTELAAGTIDRQGTHWKEAPTRNSLKPCSHSFVCILVSPCTSCSKRLLLRHHGDVTCVFFVWSVPYNIK